MFFVFMGDFPLPSYEVITCFSLTFMIILYNILWFLASILSTFFSFFEIFLNLSTLSIATKNVWSIGGKFQAKGGVQNFLFLGTKKTSITLVSPVI